MAKIIKICYRKLNNSVPNYCILNLYTEKIIFFIIGVYETNINFFFVNKLIRFNKGVNYLK